MTKPGRNQTPEPLLNQALAALKRASLQARKIAAQTGTVLVVEEHGKVRRIRVENSSEVAEDHAGYHSGEDKS